MKEENLLPLIYKNKYTSQLNMTCKKDVLDNILQEKGDSTRRTKFDPQMTIKIGKYEKSKYQPKKL